ncbi:hypothetical protein DXG03_002412 [Asterophora parasitica]|uniref:Peptidase S53 domain-containing protein n=1 Tax=Asterophora parasitica TaxID=117018 RepID=A0A9P7GCC3_9AGAR|nr:hypothetical protein DXG03_002412 [Asterophora parasitica]
MRLQLFILLGVFLAPGLGNANPHTTRGLIVHEKRASHPNLSLTRRLEPDTPLPLRIALKQQNLDRLSDLLQEVSDPQSPSYGQHWTPEKVVRTFAPPDSAASAVRRWLEASGVEPARIRRSANQAWVEVKGATAGEVERILGTKYHVYKRDTGGEHIVSDSYSLPRSISAVVDFITPTIQPDVKLDEVYTHARRQAGPAPEIVHAKRAASATKPGAPTGCDTLVTPNCLRSLYNITYVPKATNRNTFGVVNYYSNVYLQSDLDTFFRNYSPALVGKSPQLISIDGGSLDQDATTGVGEAGWVLQYAMSLVQPQPVKLLQLGNAQTGEFRSFNEWLDAVDGSYCTYKGGDDLTYDPTLPNPLPGGLDKHDCGTVKAPYVVSNSQATHEYAFSQFYLERQCAEFGKLGLLGTTVIYSAGNVGTAGTQSGYCLDKNGSMNPNATLFNPSWPASCPFITAVGGTQVKKGSAAVPGAEEVWNQEIIPGFFQSGGGGFSNRFSTPAYQKTAVQSYLQKLKKSDPAHLKLFNNQGRGYPDLSVNANSFLNVDGGEISVDSGTSGGVPTVAAIITLVNDARLAAGKKPVGFINPTVRNPRTVCISRFPYQSFFRSTLLVSRAHSTTSYLAPIKAAEAYKVNEVEASKRE